MATKRKEVAKSIAEQEHALQIYLTHEAAKNMTLPLFYEVMKVLRQMHHIGVLTVLNLKEISNAFRIQLENSVEFLTTPEQWKSYFNRVLLPILLSHVRPSKTWAEGPDPYFIHDADLEDVRKGKQPEWMDNEDWAEAQEKYRKWQMLRQQPPRRPEDMEDDEWEDVLYNLQDINEYNEVRTIEEAKTRMIKAWDRFIETENVKTNQEFLWLFLAFVFVDLGILEEDSEFVDSLEEVFTYMYLGDFRMSIDVLYLSHTTHADVQVKDVTLWRRHTEGSDDSSEYPDSDEVDNEWRLVYDNSWPRWFRKWIESMFSIWHTGYSLIQREPHSPLCIAFIYRAFKEGWRLDRASSLKNIPAILQAPICASCGISDQLQLCGGCQQVAYCGTVCQRLDWNERHKKECPK
jgi:hypothetical protein